MDSNLINKIDLDEFQKATKAVKEHYNITEEEAEQYIMQWGPKAMKRVGLLEKGESWKAGYTKPPTSKKVNERRKKNKQARKSRKKNR